MKLYIYKLGETLYEGEATSITLPASDGQLTILPHHIPLVTHLKAGTISIKNGSTEGQNFTISGGFAEVKAEKTILLVE
jgi:F-type H+-transporting ATPase subunit epsilon